MAERVQVLVKFEPELLEQINRYAAAGDLNRMAAIIALIEEGLAGGAPAAAVIPPPPKGPRGKTTLVPGRVKGVTEVAPKTESSGAGVPVKNDGVGMVTAPRRERLF